MNRLPESLVIDAAVFLNPLLDEDLALDDAWRLGEHVRKWLPFARTVIVVPRGVVLSPQARSILGRCEYVGIEVIEAGEPVGRTRQAWHVVSEATSDAALPMRGDRVHRFVAPLDGEVPWSDVRDAIVAYAAIVAIPRGGED